MATIRDIAQELHISTSTVSKGLNGGKDISEPLRRQILDTAVRLGYTKKASVHRNRRLCVFIENVLYKDKQDFGYEIILGFRQAAYREQWNVDIMDVTPDFQLQHPYDAFMTEGSFSGSFIVGFSMEDPWMKSLQDTTFPTVLLDNQMPVNPNVTCLGTDNAEAMSLAISYLIGHGHDRIAFLDGSAGSFVSDQRMLSFLNAMRQQHLPLDPDLAVYGYFVPETAQYHVPGFLSQGVTAILCGNDLIASGVITCCQEAGFRVPEDVSVIGFDDLPMAASLSPALTTIRQDRNALGRSAMYSLHALLGGVPLSFSLLRPALICRDSVAAAKPRPMTKRVSDKDSVRFVNPDLLR